MKQGYWSGGSMASELTSISFALPAQHMDVCEIKGEISREEVQPMVEEIDELEQDILDDETFETIDTREDVSTMRAIGGLISPTIVSSVPNSSHDEDSKEVSQIVEASIVSYASVAQNPGCSLPSTTYKAIAQNNEFYQDGWEVHHVRRHAFTKEKNGNTLVQAAYLKSNERISLQWPQTFVGRALGTKEEPPLMYKTHTDVGYSVSVGKSEREGHVESHNSAIQIVDNQRKGTHLRSNGYYAVLSSSDATVGVEGFLIGEEERGEESSAVVAVAAKLPQRDQEMTKARDAEKSKKKTTRRSQCRALAKAQKKSDRQEKVGVCVESWFWRVGVVSILMIFASLVLSVGSMSSHGLLSPFNR